MSKQLVLVDGVTISEKLTVNYVAGENITITITDDGDSVNIQFDAGA